MLLVLDNYDSFTYNLVHLVEQLDVPHEVWLNDGLPASELSRFSRCLVGPGPGLPANAGITAAAVAAFADRPLLGVCLGMQAMLEARGAVMQNLQSVQHGAQHALTLSSNSILFAGLEAPIRVGRYHSWGFLPNSIQPPFTVVATSADGYTMAVEHQQINHIGVQFHPESILTDGGITMLKNWLDAPFKKY